MGSRHNTWSIVVLKGILFLGAIFSNKPLSSQKNSIFTKHGNFEEFWSFFLGSPSHQWMLPIHGDLHRKPLALDAVGSPGATSDRTWSLCFSTWRRRCWNKLRKAKGQKDGAKVTPCRCWCVFLETGDSIHIFYQLNVINPKITDQNIGLSKANKSHMFLLWHKHKVEWSMHPSSALGSFEPHPVGCPPTKAPAADAPFASRASPPYLPIRPPFCSSSCWRVHGITQPIDHQTIPQENHHFLVGGINCINLPFPGKWVVYEIVLPIYFEKGLQGLDPIRQIL